MAKYKSYIYFRRFSQIFFLLLFFTLAIKTTISSNIFSTEPEISGNIKYFLSFDPLIALVVLITGHAILLLFLLSIITVLLTIFCGRLFCGFICPFGTLHHFFSYIGRTTFLKSKNFKSYGFNKWQNLKYYILLVLLLLALFKVNLSGLLDPLSFLLRSLVSFVIPLFQYLIYVIAHMFAFFNMDFFASYLQGDLVFNVFGKENIFFDQTFLIGFILLSLLFLDLFIYRFYCRFICPLGALLGLLSFKSFLSIKQKEGCINCAKCEYFCFAGANPSSKQSFKKNECMLLGNCLTECPVNILNFGNVEKNSIDFRRRDIIFAGLSTVFLAPLLRYSYSEDRTNSLLIRPPGALREIDFLQKCIRCSACIKVCPQNFLQPSLFEGRLEALWTPIGKGRYGYCEYNCNLCGQVCPTGAIKELPLIKKKKVSIGTAFIDKNRCLPYAFGIDCVVCEEMCPVSPKAIYFQESAFVKPDGSKTTIKNPIVIPDSCTGCAVCENKCPVLDKPAIYVASIGEDRSEKNRFLL
jgi:MauM/NapG family ferredoxin protein